MEPRERRCLTENAKGKVPSLKVSHCPRNAKGTVLTPCGCCLGACDRNSNSMRMDLLGLFYLLGDDAKWKTSLHGHVRRSSRPRVPASLSK